MIAEIVVCQDVPNLGMGMRVFFGGADGILIAFDRLFQISLLGGNAALLKDDPWQHIVCSKEHTACFCAGQVCRRRVECNVSE